MSETVTAKISSFLKERKGRYKPDDSAVVRLKRLEKIDFNGNIHFSIKSSKTDMIIVKKGDLVISGINVAKGALSVYEGDEDITATIHYSSYIFDTSKVNIEYFKRFLKSQLFIKLLKDQVKGGIKTEIKPKHLLPLEIELSSLNDQEKIVNFLQSTENEISDLYSEKEYQLSLLKQLRQAVLQETVEGKLTVDWRKENPDLISGENSAVNLISRVRKEKEKLIQEGKIKKQKTLPSVSEAEKPFEIPDVWIWVRLGDIIENLPRNGYSPKSVNYNTSVKTLKLGATTWGYFNPLEYKFIDEDIPDDSVFWLEPGDTLIQRSNSLDYVGVSVIYTGKSNEFIYPDLMMKFRVISLLSNNFIHKALSAPITREYYRSKAKGSQKSMPKINQGTVMNTLIPLPSFYEQNIIVEKVKVIFSMIDELEKQVSKRKVQSEQLMQVVLREAFSADNFYLKEVG